MPLRTSTSAPPALPTASMSAGGGPFGKRTTVGASSTSTASLSSSRSRAASRGAASRRPGHHLEDRHVPHAVVAGAVVAGHAGAVEHERDAALVQRDVHQHLVEGPVEERARRPRPPGAGHRSRGRRREVAACCSAMPTSKVRSGKRAWNSSSPTGCIIAAVIATTSWPAVADLRRSRRRRRRSRSGPWASPRRSATSNGPGRVELVGLVPLGRVVPEALAGDRVHDDRAAEPLGLGERLLHRGAVVAVDRADVLQAEVLEEALRRERVLDALLHRVQGVVRRGADARDGVEAALDQVEHLLVARVGAQPGERGRRGRRWSACRSGRCR